MANEKIWRQTSKSVPSIKGAPTEDPARRGVGFDPLDEEFPGFIPRKTDKVIKGENNTWIVLGRDREKDAISGYGGKGVWGAGAIDIVVGRMAPQPLTHVDGNDIAIDPLMKTVYDSTVKGQRGATEIEDPQCGPEHEGFAMDAARVYISQKADIDHYFGIRPGREAIPKKGTKGRSAVGIKSDEIRLMSRYGIKLVTEAQNIRDSQGNFKKKIYGIELIAGNGADEDAKPEPIVKALQLKQYLETMVNQVNTINGTFFQFMQEQQQFNSAVMVHTHPEIVLLGTPGVFDPILAFAVGPKNIISNVAITLPNVVNQKINLAVESVKSMAGIPAFASKYNYTN